MGLQYYAEQVRKSSTISMRNSSNIPERDRVMRDGMFFADDKCRITFRERKDLPVYIRRPCLRRDDADASSCQFLAILQRDNKGAGAWMDKFVDPSGYGHEPGVSMSNFPSAAAGQPAPGSAT